MKKVALFILFAATIVSAQELQRYDNFAATTTSASGIGNLIQAIPNATLTVFNAPAAGVSCAGGGCVAASTFTSRTGVTSCGAAVPLTRPTSTTCIGTADAQGNFGFWAAKGAYQYCIAATSFTTQCYNTIIGASLGVSTVVVDPANSAGWSGADVCAWINSAETYLFNTLSLPGGIINVAGGTYAACAGTFTVGQFSPSKTATINIGNTTITVQGSVIIEPSSELRGGGYNGPSPASIIFAGASFPTSTPVIQIDKANGVIQNARISQIAAYCNSITGCIGLDTGGAQDGSIISGFMGYRYKGNCVNVPGTVPSQLIKLYDIQCYADAAATSTDAIVLNSTADTVNLERISIVPLSAGQQATGIKCISCTFEAHDVHVEQTVDAVQISAAGGSSFVNDLNFIANVTNGVHFLSTATGSAVLTSLRNYGATNTVKNDSAGFTALTNIGTCTDAALSTYEVHLGKLVRANCGSILTIAGDAGANDADLNIANIHASGHVWEIGEMFSVGRLDLRDTTQTGKPAWGFQTLGTIGTEGILSHSNTAARTYTFPDATGQVPITPNLVISATAPTIAAAGCGGSAASITASNGTAAFKINVGTAPTASCTVTMPTATTGWNCHADDITTQTTAVFVQKQTGAESQTSVTITNFNDVAVSAAYAASDVLKVTCSAD